MTAIHRFFQNKKCNLTFGNNKTFSDTKWVKPNFDPSQIRLIIFGENDVKGRMLLFDSKSIQRIEELNKCCSAAKFLHNSKSSSQTEKGTTPRYRYLKPSSDIKMLEEMMFGSVAMSYRGSTMKVHSIKTPPQLMVSKVFIPERSKATEGDSSDDIDSFTNLSNDITSPRHIYKDLKDGPFIAQSIPVDVPIVKYPTNDDSGIASSVNSTGSFTPFPCSTGSSGTSFYSGSYNSLHRRWMRNMSKSIERCVCQRSAHDASKNSTSSRTNKDRVAIGILLQASSDKARDNIRLFQNFFFTHVTIFEGRIAKLQNSIGNALYKRNNFIHIVNEAFKIFQQELCDLYTAPRLSEPVWLNMMSYGNYRSILCEQFMKEFMSLYKYDTKSTKFFLSSVVSAVLTHHLAWVPTVTPAGAPSSRTYLKKHTAQWLDMLAKTHPYNPIWAQLGDMYGSIGYPLKLSRTVVVGKKSDQVSKLLYILSYFIRCSELHRTENTNTDSDVLKNFLAMDFNDLASFSEPGTPRFDTFSVNTSSSPVSRLSHSSSSQLSPRCIESDEKLNTINECSTLTCREVVQCSSPFNVVSRKHHHDDKHINEAGVQLSSMSNVNISTNTRNVEMCESVIDDTRIEFHVPSSTVLNQSVITDTGVESLGSSGAISNQSTTTNISREVCADLPAQSCQIYQTSHDIDVKLVVERHRGQDASISPREPTPQAPNTKRRSLLTEQLSHIRMPPNPTPNSSGTCKCVSSSLNPTHTTLDRHSENAQISPISINHNNRNITTCTGGADSKGNDSSHEVGSSGNYSMFDEYFESCVETKTIDDVPTNQLVLKDAHFLLNHHKHKVKNQELSIQIPINADSFSRLGSNTRHTSGTSSCDSDVLDPLVNCSEICLPKFPQVSPKQRKMSGNDQYPGRTLMASYSDHYLPDFVLHGTSDLNLYRKLADDLSISVQQSVLDENVSEAVAIVADMDKWCVDVISSRVSKSPGWIASSLVCNMLESVNNLWKLKMSPEFCIMHLEDKLQEIYFKSRTFDEYLQSHQTASLDSLCSTLRLDSSDLPLLLAISTTYVHSSSQKSSRSSTESDMT